MTLKEDGQPSDEELDYMEAGPTEIPRLRRALTASREREQVLQELLRRSFPFTVGIADPTELDFYHMRNQWDADVRRLVPSLFEPIGKTVVEPWKVRHRVYLRDHAKAMKGDR